MSDTREEVSEVSEVMPEVSEVANAVDVLPEEPVGQLPGASLRAAREARNLSIFEVAQSLKFGPRQVTALEADDYAALPAGATFQRGFLRSYAKLLKIDAEPLLAMLDARTPIAPPDVRAPQNMGVAATPVTSGRRSSRPLLLGSAVLALLAAGLAALNFFGHLDPQAIGVPAAPSSPVAADAAVRAPDVRVEPAAPMPGTGEPVTVAPVAADTQQLVFTFHDKSWVEVRDATQRSIFSAENAAGTRQVVVGKPPFQVVVGNAAKVEVQLDDRVIDLAPHTRAEVARLTIE